MPGLLTWLVENGFHATSAVELPGEFSSRGGILDIFAPDWHEPVRIEFFGDEVESLRRFEVATQRSLGSLETVDVTALAPSDDDREHFAGYLPPDSWFVLVEPGDIEDEGRHFLERLERPQDVHGLNSTLTRNLSLSLGHAGRDPGRLDGNHLSSADRIGRAV